MNRATPQQRTAAERLLELEVKGKAPIQPAASRVTDRLGRVLRTQLGANGYRALLARALVLAKAEARGLDAVQLTSDGSLEGLNLVEPRRGQPRFTEGEIVVVAHVLGLLVTFVGEALMLQFVNDAWPKADLGDIHFDDRSRS